MVQDIGASRRDLVVRVATLELLVADLIDLLWRADPKGMDQMARDAAADLEIQTNRIAPAAVEARHERLFAVLNDRRHKLSHRRGRRREELALHDVSVEIRR